MAIIALLVVSLLGLAGMALFFLPSIVAHRRHCHFGIVLTLNFLLIIVSALLGFVGLVVWLVILALAAFATPRYATQ